MRLNRQTIRRRPADRRPGRLRTGTALLELVALVPLIGLIIGLTFFFGWSRKNQQHLEKAARYATWRRVHNNQARADGLGGGANVVGVGDEWINDEFLQGAATADDGDVLAGVDYGGGSGETRQAYVAVGQNAGAGELAGDLVLRRWPGGVVATVRAEFPTDVGLWNNLGLTGEMTRRDAREGVAWRRSQARNEGAIRDVFLEELDWTLNNIAEPGAGLGQTFRRLYLNGW